MQAHEWAAERAERGLAQCLGRCRRHCPGEKNPECLEHSGLGLIAAYLITGIVCKFNIVVVVVVSMVVRTNEQASKHKEKQDVQAAGESTRECPLRLNDFLAAIPTAIPLRSIRD